jgi:hypothetical protein
MDLARRFRGLPADSPRLGRDVPYEYRVGEEERFNVLDLSVPSLQEVRATLRHITAHAYFFVEAGTPVSQATLDRVGADFENIVYPTISARFGSEWTPGVDSDPRITLLHANLRGAGGYILGFDEFPAAIAPQSNEREMLYLESGELSSPGVPYNSLVAHELQHLIHWHADEGEDSWVNEGLSQVASEEVGGGSQWLPEFLAAPDTQLNYWPELESSAIHYAASELFMSYLLDRFGGRENAYKLVQQKRDGVLGVQAYLDEFAADFDDVFADWTVANYLDTDSGPYSHASTDFTTRTTTGIGEPRSGEGEVGQFAADYLEVDTGSGPTFTFDGSDEVSIGVPPLDGPFWWGNRGDSIDAKLTREFDLRGLTSATLRFSTWYDIEGGWDYAYVAASVDGGKTWTALGGSETSDYDPIGASYGPGYTGSSDGWVEEEIDLSAYAGRRVLLRFEYVTDDATSLTGFAVDNIEVPELGFRDGADTAEGWSVEGFVRIEGPLPQRFIVQVIDPSESRVARIPLDESNRGTALLGSEPAIIVISGVTRDTTERARYTWSVAP